MNTLNIGKMNRADVIVELRRKNLPTKGKLNVLKRRLENFYETAALNESSEADSMSDIDIQIQEKEEELRALRRRFEQDQRKSRDKRSSQREMHEQANKNENAQHERNNRRPTFQRQSSPLNERNDMQYGRLRDQDSTIQRMRNSMESLLRDLGCDDNMAHSRFMRTHIQIRLRRLIFAILNTH